MSVRDREAPGSNPGPRPLLNSNSPRTARRDPDFDRRVTGGPQIPGESRNEAARFHQVTLLDRCRRAPHMSLGPLDPGRLRCRPSR